MILFAKDNIEDDFKAGIERTDPRPIACMLQLSAMRQDLDFILTSGGRTPEHNKEIGGHPDSGHITIPITAWDMLIRHKITQESIDRLEKERIKNYLQFWWGDLFDWVIYNGSPHVHLEVDKPFRKKLLTK